MKIALLNDYKEYAGAEISIKQRLAVAPKNMTIDFKLPGEPIDFGAYDGFILENTFMFQPQFLFNIVHERPFIKVEHDYNYCHYRNQIDCKNCDLPCPILTNPVTKMIYENAKVVIAASPAHKGLVESQLTGYKWKVNVDYNLPYTYKDQKIPEVERVPKSVAYLGTLRKFKGIYEIIELATRKVDHHFDIAGKIGYIKGNLPTNVSYLGAVEDKWKYLASHEYFIHLPRHPDPCPGTIIEAILSGCKIIFNVNVGTLSYPYKTRQEWVDALAKSGDKFWEKVTQHFKKETTN